MTMDPVQVQQIQPRAAPAPLQFTGPAAIAPATSLKGAQVLAATIQAPALLGYYYGLMAVAGDLTAIRRSIDAIARATADAVDTMLQAAWDSLGLEDGNPRERLQGYIAKSAVDWAEQQAKYPGDYAKDRADYESLKLKAINGEL